VKNREPDRGDLVIVLLAESLAGLRDQLAAVGFDGVSELVGTLTEGCESWLEFTDR
jgi:hypothetical protein